MTPRVGIGLPVYNGERFLDQCLRSALAQTLGDFELVISDNHSSDGTEEICRRFAALDQRVCYLRGTRNRGAAWNHNHVFFASRAPYFKWLAADDVLHPRFLEACAGMLNERADAALCYPKTIVIDEDGSRAPMEEETLPFDSPDVLVRFTRLMDSWRACHNPFYGVMRRSALAKTRLLGTYLGADRALLAELSLLGPFVEYPERLFFRRKHSQNLGLPLDRQQAIYHPQMRGRISLRENRLCREHLAIVARSELPAPMKARLSGRVLRRIVAERATLLDEVGAAAGQAAREMFHQ